MAGKSLRSDLYEPLNDNKCQFGFFKQQILHLLHCFYTRKCYPKIDAFVQSLCLQSTTILMSSLCALKVENFNNKV